MADALHAPRPSGQDADEEKALASSQGQSYEKRSQAALRRGFIRKVLGLTATNMLIIFGVILLFTLHAGLRKWAGTAEPAFYVGLWCVGLCVWESVLTLAPTPRVRLAAPSSSASWPCASHRSRASTLQRSSPLRCPSAT